MPVYNYASHKYHRLINKKFQKIMKIGVKKTPRHLPGCLIASVKKLFGFVTYGEFCHMF